MKLDKKLKTYLILSTLGAMLSNLRWWSFNNPFLEFWLPVMALAVLFTITIAGLGLKYVSEKKDFKNKFFYMTIFFLEILFSLFNVRIFFILFR